MPTPSDITVEVMYNRNFMSVPFRADPSLDELEVIHTTTIDISEMDMHRFISDTDFRTGVLEASAEHFFETFNIGAGRQLAPRSMSVGDVVRFTFGESIFNLVCNHTGWVLTDFE